MVGAAQGDVAQTLDTVGFADEVADALVERPGRFVGGGGVMVGASEGDGAKERKNTRRRDQRPLAFAPPLPPLRAQRWFPDQ